MAELYLTDLWYVMCGCVLFVLYICLMHVLPSWLFIVFFWLLVNMRTRCVCVCVRMCLCAATDIPEYAHSDEADAEQQCERLVQMALQYAPDSIEAHQVRPI